MVRGKGVCCFVSFQTGLLSEAPKSSLCFESYGALLTGEAYGVYVEHLFQQSVSIMKL